MDMLTLEKYAKANQLGKVFARLIRRYEADFDLPSNDAYNFAVATITAALAPTLRYIKSHDQGAYTSALERLGVSLQNATSDIFPAHWEYHYVNIDKELPSRAVVSQDLSLTLDRERLHVDEAVRAGITAIRRRRRDEEKRRKEKDKRDRIKRRGKPVAVPAFLTHDKACEIARSSRDPDLDAFIRSFKWPAFIGIRLWNCVSNDDLTFRQLVEMPDYELLRCPNFGRKSLALLRSRLALYKAKERAPSVAPVYMAHDKACELACMPTDDACKLALSSRDPDLDAFIRSFEWPVGNGTRLWNCVGRDSLTFRQLVEMPDNELLRCPNFGRKCLALLRSKLALHKAKERARVERDEDVS